MHPRLTRQTWHLPTALALAAAALILVRGRSGERGAPLSTATPMIAIPPDSEFAGTVAQDRRVGDWRLRVLNDSAAGESVFDLTRRGRRAWAVRAAGIRLLLVGRDITGDGTPDVVVEQFSGGMHCCTQSTVLGLGPTLRVYGTIDGADGEVEFEDVDGDGVMEARIGDWRFAYWRGYPFVETQVPDVILRYGPSGYRPACNLMRAPTPDSVTLAARARELSADWSSGDPPADLWGYAVDLVYQGHPQLAWRFLEGAWPPGISGRDEFLRDLRAKLEDSPCWSPPPPPRPAA